MQNGEDGESFVCFSDIMIISKTTMKIQKTLSNQFGLVKRFLSQNVTNDRTFSGIQPTGTLHLGLFGSSGSFIKSDNLQKKGKKQYFDDL